MLRNSNATQVFDCPHAIALAEAKKVFFDKFFRKIKEVGLTTALDAGCGLGYFSGYLTDIGFQVTAFDCRPENVSEASKRNPGVKFVIHNVEDSSINTLGLYDTVFCLGLLYHLENPFRAIRHLTTVTKKVLVIETMIAPSKSLIAVLREEAPGKDQSINCVALIPSESCFIKMLYKAGFPLVYRSSLLPNHEDYRSSMLRSAKRTILVASKTAVQHPILRLIKEPRQSNRHMWYIFGLRNILENKLLRRILRGALKFIDSVPRRE